MRGTAIGALYVYTTSRGQDNPIDRIVGEQGDQWLQRQIDVYLNGNDRVIVIFYFCLQSLEGINTQI